ncbi:MAG TPA: type II toxin-antitoxin system HicA family toxin [Stellaceae bacterium]|nr:type II toxin-antitoxin system HicA family toxin [Stellaceae bacterium]
MNGAEFIRRLEALAKRTGTTVRLDKRHGKGSHATLYYGARKTTVKDRKKEIGPALLSAMLRQLGLSKEDFF